MDKRLWLLVEWVDVANMFSNYGVVNSNSLFSPDADVHIGKIVFVCDKNNKRGARKAQVLRICDNKRHAKELKLMLERQDNQVKNVLSLCMNTIKEMKTGPLFLGSNQPSSISCPSDPSMHKDDTDSSDSDSDQAVNNELNFTKASVKYMQPIQRPESSASGQISRLLNDRTLMNNRRSLISSTPLPERHSERKPKLTFDQSTQTDLTELASMNKVAELEAVVHRLYGQFLNLLSDLNINEQSISMEKKYEHSFVLENNADETTANEDVVIVETRNDSSTELEVNKKPAKGLQVRRASAHTTNAGLPAKKDILEPVPIGAGYATVAAYIMEKIDWTSYTTATRQLLQAVFPRRVLATHSLTGKQCPAFADKPPKKRLDPLIINDIVSTVSERSGIPPRIVRSCITTKCMDEAKLYRNRQFRKKQQNLQNQENVPPSTSPASSNDSSNVVQ